MAKVKVRIAVGVDHTGDWNCCGCKSGMKDEQDMMNIACETLEPGEARYFVEAELNMPAQNTVQGTVTKGN